MSRAESTATPPRPTADVSVRIAWADDADAIAGVQVRAWPELYADLLPAEVLPTDVDAVAAQWRQVLAQVRPTPATACWSPSSATGSWASP